MRRSHPPPRVPAALCLALLAVAGLPATPAFAQTTPPGPAAAQPSLPRPIPAPTKPGSPVVERIVGGDQPPLEVRKPPLHLRETRYHRSSYRHLHRRAAHRRQVPRDLDRPALAGVELVAPLPPPGQPPHLVVPLPAYPLDSVAAALTMPAPPVVCHRVRRDPDAPDPHLYRETPVLCVPDNP